MQRPMHMKRKIRILATEQSQKAESRCMHDPCCLQIAKTAKVGVAREFAVPRVNFFLGGKVQNSEVGYPVGEDYRVKK